MFIVINLISDEDDIVIASVSREDEHPNEEEREERIAWEEDLLRREPELQISSAESIRP